MWLITAIYNVSSITVSELYERVDTLEMKLICPKGCLQETSFFYYDIDKSTRYNKVFICPICKSRLLKVDKK